MQTYRKSFKEIPPNSILANSATAGNHSHQVTTIVDCLDSTTFKNFFDGTITTLLYYYSTTLSNYF